MADISSVKLPDASEYDVTDAEALHSSDPVNNLNSTSTTLPLAANMGHAIGDNLTANEENGAKNLAILNLSSIMSINTGGTWSGNVYSHRSVNFTVTDNGVSVSGTASGGAAFIDIPISPLTNGKNYIANGISGGADETYQIKFMNSSLVVQSVSDLYDGERTFEKNSTNQNVEIYRIRVASGANVTTEIYPMIRDARILDPTFAPFAETNLQLTKKTSGLSNENLLDNPWFTVNQRGFTSHTMDTYYFPTADRWLGISSDYGGVVTLGASGMNFNKEGYSSPFYLTQKMEVLAVGKVYTLSVLFSDGTIEYGTGTINSTSDYVEFEFSGLRGKARIYYLASWSQWLTDIVAYAGANFTVRAIKLEVGSVSTLANDVEPNYTTELLKCQRYFERVKLLGSANSYALFGMGHADSTAVARVIIWCQPKRTLPTLSFTGSFYLGTNAVTGMAAQQMTNAGIAANVASSGLVQDNLYVLVAGNTGYYIDISADL